MNTRKQTPTPRDVRAWVLGATIAGLFAVSCAPEPVLTDAGLDASDAATCDGECAYICGDGVCDPGEECDRDCYDPCGDGLCFGGEDPETCEADCPSTCGDGYCTSYEAACLQDCGPECGDGRCDGPDEDTVNCSVDCGTRCGDGVCGGAESTVTCEADCPPICGDGDCTAPENTVNCVEDCSSACGDGVCNGAESALICADDCPPICGDGVCSGTENAASCASDCPAVCGDGVCSTPETTATCVDDCGSACGDGACNAAETAGTCPADCPASCGDGTCSDGETAVTCGADCPPSCGDGACNGAEASTTCPADCGSACGDGVCNGDETSGNCVVDCGTRCGDGSCNGTESNIDCPDDCGSVCGDATCNGDESSATCHVDCGTRCGDTVCNGTEGSVNCAEDCGSACGDGACNGTETSVNCTVDCGTTCGDGVCNGTESSAACPDDCGGTCGDGVCNGGETAHTCCLDCADTCHSSVTQICVMGEFRTAGGDLIYGRDVRWERTGDWGGDNDAQTAVYGYWLLAEQGPADLAVGNSLVEIVRWGATPPAGQSWEDNVRAFFEDNYAQGCRIFMYPYRGTNTSQPAGDTIILNFARDAENRGDPVAVVLPAPTDWINLSAFDNAVFGGNRIWPTYLATSDRPYFVVVSGMEDSHEPVRWAGYESTHSARWPVDAEATIRARDVVDGAVVDRPWVGTQFGAASVAGALGYLLANARYHGYDVGIEEVRSFFLSDGLGAPFTHAGTRYDFPFVERHTGDNYTDWDEIPEDPRLSGVTHQFDDATDRYVTSGSVVREMMRRGVYSPSSAPVIYDTFIDRYPPR